MEEGRVADYFVVAGLPSNPVPLEEFSNEAVLKSTHRQDPIVDLAIINRSLSEVAPPHFRCIEFTPTGHPADLNHGSIRAPEMYICYRRGRDKPPLVDIGILYEGKERVMPGCEVLYLTPHGRSANINNSNNTRIYVTFRRADVKAASDTLAVMDIAVILANKGEEPPYAFCRINKVLNKGMMGSDVYLSYKKSTAKTHFLAYKPAVLHRYPVDNLPGFDLPDRLAMFCLPLGAIIESWPADAHHPAPVFSTFVLTAAASEGDRVYGAAVMFYEEMDLACLDDVQRQHLTPQSNDPNQPSCRIVAQNKSICLLSRLPFFDAFKQFLVYLYRMSLASSLPHPAPIERFISHFLTEVPCPSPQRPRIMIQLSTSAITLCQPDETPLPKSGASFVEMLKNLGPLYCVSLLLYTLLEQKLLIHSVRPAVLTSVAEAISCMIFPFHWQCPYIPMCPLSLSYVLHSPTPFIIGVDSRYFDLYDPPHDVICVDLDTNTLTVPLEDRKGQSVRMLHLPKKATKVLKTTLERLYEQLHQDLFSSYTSSSSELWLDTTPVDHDSKVWKKKMHMETLIREAFLRFMAVILKGYNSFLLPITKAPTLVTTDVSSLFDIQGFLKSRDKSYHKFYTHLMKMQAFSRFIEERSFVSNKDTSLAFFDECLDRVDETRDEPRLIENDDTLRSERTAFVMPPEPTGLPPGAEYSYRSFPELDAGLYPRSAPQSAVSAPRPSVTLASGLAGQLCPYSPMTRRTKQEVKAMQKLLAKQADSPSLWARCLLWHCYSLWFIHLPSYMKTVHSKTKALRAAYDVLLRMQEAKLQPPDEVCYRVLMQLCGLYHQPVLAVRVLFAMRRSGVQPNAITYGFYNKAVLESKWPTGSLATGFQLWMKLRNVVSAVAQFRTALGDQRVLRRPSLYSSSDDQEYDEESIDSIVDACTFDLGNVGPVAAASHSIIVDNDVQRQNIDSSGNRVVWLTSSTSKENLATNRLAVHEEAVAGSGLSDRGYNSMSSEDARRIVASISHTDTADVTPVADSRDEDIRDLQEEEADVGDMERVRDETVENEPDSCASVNEQSETCENTTSVSTEGPDSSSVTTPESAANVDTALSLGVNTDSCSGDKHSAIDATHLNTDSVLSNPLSPVNSPVHVVRMLITQDDPLGLFTNTVTSTSSKTTTDPGSSQSSDNVTESACMQEENVLIRRISEDAIGRTSWVAAATDSSLRKCSSLNRLSSEGAHHKALVARSTVVNPVAMEPGSHPSSASPRTSLLGGTFRSAASRFALKCREIRESVAPPSQSAKVVPPLPSETSQEQCVPDAGDVTPTTVTSDRSGVDNAETDYVAVRSCENTSSTASKTVPDITVTTQAAKSRLRVPTSLYSPLVTSVLGGLKSLQSNEALLGFANSLGSMTVTMRDVMIESWGVTDEMEELAETEQGLSTAAENGNKRPSESDTETEHYDHSVQSDCDEGVLSGSALDRPVLVSTEDSSEQGSVADQPSMVLQSSTQSIPQSETCNCETAAASVVAVSPVEVDICSLSRCHTCDNLLYDEEIMAGWTADDSNLNTICQFCGSKLVPFLQIYIRDFRHSVRPSLTNLSQSMDSMLSVQSALGIQTNMPNSRRIPCEPTSVTAILEDTAAPSTDSGVETGAVDLPDSEGIASQTTPSEALNSVTSMSSDNDITLVNAETTAKQLVSPPSVHISVINATSCGAEAAVCRTVSCSSRPPTTDLNNRRWGSTDLCHSAGAGCDLHSQLAESRASMLEKRRWTSEFSLAASSRTDPRSVTTVTAASVSGDARVDDQSSIASLSSDSKQDNGVKKCIQLDPLTIPYLSPLVLRKEMENVLDQYGDACCLNSPEFIDHHPIIYWNLVWYFRRLNVPTHMPGFILTAKCVNQSMAPSNVWTSNDSRFVGLHTNWDDVRMHGDLGPPMYILFTRGAPSATLPGTSQPERQTISKSMMQSIVASIKENDVVSPLRLLLNERAKQRDCGRTRFHSIYRDILFLSFVALGRDCIDHDSYDREFHGMYEELPPRDKARMRVADRAPNALTVSCRRLFGNLEF